MPILKPNRRLLAFGHDTAVAALAFLLALYLRMGNDAVNLPFGAVATAVVLFTLTCAIVFWACGLYRSIWAFASLRDLKEILRAATIAVAVFLMLAFLTTRLEGVPRTVPFMAWFILLAGLGGSRMAFRMLRERRLSVLWERSGGGRVHVLLVGAGDEADLFLRALNSNPQAPFRVVGIIGDNDRRVGRSIHGVDVLGTLDQLPQIVERLRNGHCPPSRIILTRSITRFNGALVADLLEKATALGLTLSRLPCAHRSPRRCRRPSAVHDQPVVLEDLLGRPETKLNRADIRALDQRPARACDRRGRHHRVGAGAPDRRARTEMRSPSANSANTISIASRWRSARLSPTSSSTRSSPMCATACDMEQIFHDEKPELVFHAAAIKHVPIAEANARETILTNVHGTRTVADCAARAGLRRDGA